MNVPDTQNAAETDAVDAKDPKSAVHWNDPAILAAAGTAPEVVANLMSRHGQGVPTEYAVYQWASRNKIPDKWRSRLVYCLLREDKIKLAALFRRGSARRTVRTRGPLAGQPL